MNTRLLMRATAVLLGVLGAAATFLPQEILLLGGTTPVPLTVALVQITGALYLGFAMLDWMAQGNVIGGIYSRPVAIGNLAHFTIGGLVLLKAVIAGHHSLAVVAVAAAYAAFAALFGRVAFAQPTTRLTSHDPTIQDE